MRKLWFVDFSSGFSLKNSFAQSITRFFLKNSDVNLCGPYAKIFSVMLWSEIIRVVLISFVDCWVNHSFMRGETTLEGHGDGRGCIRGVTEDVLKTGHAILL